MGAEKSERRRNPRIFFLKDEYIGVQLKKRHAEGATVHAMVKDLSLAGIGFLLRRTEPVIVAPGDRLIVANIQGTNAVDFLIQSTLEVEWVLDTDVLDHIGFGCSFLNLKSSTQAKLETYVSAWK